MKVECKIQGCALNPFLFVMLIDYLFQDIFLNWLSQLIFKNIFRRLLATPDLSRLLFMALIVRVISVQ
jgi:hypothetical protein